MMKPIRPKLFDLNDYKSGNEVGVLLRNNWTIERVLEVTKNGYVITTNGYVFSVDCNGFGRCTREIGKSYPSEYPFISPISSEILNWEKHRLALEEFDLLKNKIDLLDTFQLETIVEILKKATSVVIDYDPVASFFLS